MTRYAPVAAGVWGEVKLIGAERIEVDGYSYNVPADSELKVVRSIVGQFLHVRSEGRVSVLHRGRQLIEDDAAARQRAVESRWYALATH